MADQLQSMRIFVKVAEMGSFATAAAQLGLSPQMVGRHVATLEARLGTRLLHRTTHVQRLTEAGRVYLDGCRAALSQIAAIDLSVSAHGKAVQGRLRISAPLGLGTILSRTLPALLETHRALSVELHLSDGEVDLVADGFDAAIRIGNLPDSALVTRSLGVYRVITCAAPDYLDRRGRPRVPADLAGFDCLDFVFPTHPAPHLWTYRRGDEVVRVEPEARFLVNDGRALVEAALNGFGIIQVGEIKVREDLVAGRLVRLLEEWSGPERPMQLVVPSGRMQSPALRSFGDWLVSIFPAFVDQARWSSAPSSVPTPAS